MSDFLSLMPNWGDTEDVIRQEDRSLVHSPTQAVWTKHASPAGKGYEAIVTTVRQ